MLIRLSGCPEGCSEATPVEAVMILRLQLALVRTEYSLRHLGQCIFAVAQPSRLRVAGASPPRSCERRSTCLDIER
jgi:hypothetical protein